MPKAGKELGAVPAACPHPTRILCMPVSRRSHRAHADPSGRGVQAQRAAQGELDPGFVLRVGSWQGAVGRPQERGAPEGLSAALPLQLAFFHVRGDDKPAVLLHLLRSVVKPQDQTVVFVATKHHTEYLKEASGIGGTRWVWGGCGGAPSQTHVGLHPRAGSCWSPSPFLLVEGEIPSTCDRGDAAFTNSLKKKADCSGFGVWVGTLGSQEPGAPCPAAEGAFPSGI